MCTILQISDQLTSLYFVNYRQRYMQRQIFYIDLIIALLFPS